MAKTTEGFVAKALSGATAMMDPMSETWEANLPVSAVYIWAHNGKPEFQEGVPRFGGFAASAESVIDAVESNDLTIPANWDSLELHGREGAYGAYLARSMIVAPIGFRLRWMNGSTGEYQLTFDRDGGYTRRHVQVLCGLGHIPSETIEQAGYCVLPAKGYQAGNLMDSLRDFYNALAPARKAAGADNGVAQCAFWHSIGTFGEEPDYQQVGSSAKSVITPIKAHPKYMSEEITETRLKTIFVGRENYEKFGKVAQDAEEWLNAWQMESSTNGTAPSVDAPIFADSPVSAEDVVNQLF